MPDYGAWIGVTSKDQLQGVRPDPNPTIDCDICGVGFGWKEYWKERLLLGDAPEQRFICDECQERAAELHDRLVNNRTLEEWTNAE